MKLIKVNQLSLLLFHALSIRSPRRGRCQLWQIPSRRQFVAGGRGGLYETKLLSKYCVIIVFEEVILFIMHLIIFRIKLFNDLTMVSTMFNSHAAAMVTKSNERAARVDISFHQYPVPRLGIKPFHYLFMCCCVGNHCFHEDCWSKASLRFGSRDSSRNIK